jgi:O-methyltransferase domain/Dimerisation domain
MQYLKDTSGPTYERLAELSSRPHGRRVAGYVWEPTVETRVPPHRPRVHDGAMKAADQLRQMVNGYQVAQALHVAATLGISDLLAAGPRSVADLATTAGADPDTLGRLLHALSTVGIYARTDDASYSNTELGAALRSDAPNPVAGWARQVGRPYYWQAWAHLLHSVRTGENSFAALHGTSIWRYRAEHPEEQEIFDHAMTSLSTAMARAVVDAYDFGRFTTVVDVGAGRGVLLAAVLARHPHLRGVLFDQPDVVNAPDDLLERAGVAGRCTRVGGDFFTTVPDGGDAYMLKAVIHDWPDAESIAILRTVAQALPDDGVLLLVEHLLDDGPDPVRVAFSDLNMLVAPGGRERTLDQYRTLLATAGLDLTAAVPTGTTTFVLEARPPAR